MHPFLISCYVIVGQVLCRNKESKKSTLTYLARGLHIDTIIIKSCRKIAQCPHSNGFKQQKALRKLVFDYKMLLLDECIDHHPSSNGRCGGIVPPGHALLLFSHLPSLGMLGPETREQQISALITKSKQEKCSDFFSETSKVTLLSHVLIVFSFKYI